MHETTISIIEETLKDLDPSFKVRNVLLGPVVFTYIIKPKLEIPHEKKLSLEETLFQKLNTAVRVITSIHGKPSLAIEIQRNKPEKILLKDLLTSEPFMSSPYTLPLVMGLNTFGKIIIKDLADLHTLFIAGTTGSGKSNFISAMILSLIQKNTPEDLKFILNDPKRVELTSFKKIPPIRTIYELSLYPSSRYGTKHIRKNHH